LSSRAPAIIKYRETVARILAQENLEHFGLTELNKPFSIGLYDEWLKLGRNGDMSYLAAHADAKANPKSLGARLQSAIVVTKNYVPHPKPANSWPLKGGAQVAAYARGRDYHHFFLGQLNRVANELSKIFPGEEFTVFVDSGPVLERDLAARAGLGWIGKNTCLIDRTRGSLFWIGEIYTSMDLSVDSDKRGVTQPLSADFCGTCTRCLDACPTGALVSPRELDARLCISYLTIESKEPAPLSLRKKIGDWIFGCDICQTVCPWNIKALGAELMAETVNPSKSDRQALVDDLSYILNSSIRALERDFHGTALARVNGIGLKKNAIVVAANRHVTEVVPQISKLLTHFRLGELAKWALDEMQAN
jgi:epoxyqueuosine reductase